MFETNQLGNFHQPAQSHFIKYLAAGSKHFPEFKSQHRRVTATHVSINCDLLFRAQTVKSCGLEEYRSASVGNDEIHLASVKRNDLAIPAFDVSTGNEASVWSKCLTRPLQDVEPFLFTQIIDVAGIHIDCVNESGLMSSSQMILKRLDVDPAVISERQ